MIGQPDIDTARIEPCGVELVRFDPRRITGGRIAGNAGAIRIVDRRRVDAKPDERGIGELGDDILDVDIRSEEHTSELQSLMRISYAVFCLNKQTRNITNNTPRL